ncbi:MAG: hypothetical protein NVSMB65_14220 [Chloroflexota bacterium]
MKLNGKQINLASGHRVDEDVILLQYNGSFPGGTTGELKRWHALRKAGSAAQLEPGAGVAPIAVQVIGVGAVRSGHRPNDPAHTVYVEVRRLDATGGNPVAAGDGDASAGTQPDPS